MSNNIRVVVCDNSPIVRYGLRNILSSSTNIEIVKEVSAHQQMLAAISGLDADILIVDLSLDIPSEIDCLRKFREISPDTRIIVFTDSRDDELIMQVLKLGVRGYKLKHVSTEEIINTIREVSLGKTCLDSCATVTLLKHMQTNRDQDMSSLTDREQQVLNLIAKGKSNGEIAQRLYITTRTVKFHASSIFAKLNVKNRTEAALKVA